MQSQRSNICINYCLKQKKVNQIGSFICLPSSSECDGSESSQLKSKAIDEYKITAGIKNHAIKVRDYL